MIVFLTIDEKKSRELQADLSSLGHQFQSVASAAEFAASMATHPDLAVIDVTVPAIQSKGCLDAAGTVPLLALAPETHVDECMSGRYDDFLIEPVRRSELVSRVLRLLRTGETPHNGGLLVSQNLTIDVDDREAWIGGKKLDLTFREYELLEYFARNPNRVLSRGTLLTDVWGSNYLGGGRTVDVHVRKLRSKIETDGTGFIHTVRNVGYRFRPVADAARVSDVLSDQKPGDLVAAGSRAWS